MLSESIIYLCSRDRYSLKDTNMANDPIGLPFPSPRY